MEERQQETPQAAQWPQDFYATFFFRECKSRWRINRPSAHMSMHYPALDREGAVRERAVWRAVIMQALSDAGNRSHKQENLKARREAIEWLTGFSEDFMLVCQLAGLEPDYVRERAQKAMEVGCTWRNDAKRTEIMRKKETG